MPRHHGAPSLRSSDSYSGHARANGSAHRYASWVKVIETEDVDAEVVGRYALAVERVDPTCLAKVVGRGVGMKLVGGERPHVAEQAKRALMHLHHQRVLAPANRAVTGRQFGEIGIDFKSDRAAVAATGIGFAWTASHVVVAISLSLVAYWLHMKAFVRSRYADSYLRFLR